MDHDQRRVPTAQSFEGDDVRAPVAAGRHPPRLVDLYHGWTTTDPRELPRDHTEAVTGRRLQIGYAAHVGQRVDCGRDPRDPGEEGDEGRAVLAPPTPRVNDRATGVQGNDPPRSVDVRDDGIANRPLYGLASELHALRVTGRAEEPHRVPARQRHAMHVEADGVDGASRTRGLRARDKPERERHAKRRANQSITRDHAKTLTVTVETPQQMRRIET